MIKSTICNYYLFLFFFYFFFFIVCTDNYLRLYLLLFSFTSLLFSLFFYIKSYWISPIRYALLKTKLERFKLSFLLTIYWFMNIIHLLFFITSVDFDWFVDETTNDALEAVFICFLALLIARLMYPKFFLWKRYIIFIEKKYYVMYNTYIFLIRYRRIIINVLIFFHLFFFLCFCWQCYLLLILL